MSTIDLDTNDPILAKRVTKIEALLRKAESTEHPEEAKTFTEKAHALMTEWAIDEAAIRMAKPISDIREEIACIDIVIKGGATTQMDQSLIAWLVQGLQLQTFYRDVRDPDGGKRPAKCFQVYGFPGDLERFKMLYTSLRIQRDNALRSPEVKSLQAIDADLGGYLTAGARGGHALRFRNAFAINFAAEVGSRLEETIRVTADQYIDAPGTDLVLASQADVLDTWFDEKFRGGLKKGSRSQVGGSHTAAAAGRRAGRNASIAAGEVG